MVSFSYQVQDILRKYAQQLSRGHRMDRIQVGRQPMADQVNISAKVKRKQVIESITSKIAKNKGSSLTEHREGLAWIEDQALKKLSREYGQALDIAQDEKSGKLIFKVVDPGQVKLVQTLGPKESADLEDRLYAITHEIIGDDIA